MFVSNNNNEEEREQNLRTSVKVATGKLVKASNEGGGAFPSPNPPLNQK